MATQEDMKKTWNGESRGYEEDVEGRIKRIGRKRGMANQEDIKKKWIVATIVVSSRVWWNRKRYILRSGTKELSHCYVCSL